MDKGQRTAVLVSIGLLVVVVVPVLFVVRYFIEQSKNLTHEETIEVSETGERLYRVGTDGFASIFTQRGSAMMVDGLVEKPSQLCLDSALFETRDEADSVRIWLFVTNRTKSRLDSVRVLIVQGTDGTRQEIQDWGAEWPSAEEVSGTWLPMDLLPGQEKVALLLFGTDILTTPDACQAVVLSTPTSAIQ